MDEKVKDLLERIKRDDRTSFFGKQEKLGDEELNAQLTAWCEKLESGEYTQAEGCLYDDEKNSYCCLGIAGLVCDVDPQDMSWLNYPDESSLIESSGETLWYFLQNAELNRHLSELNDTDEFTFEEIASIIRYKYNL